MGAQHFTGPSMPPPHTPLVQVRAVCQAAFWQETAGNLNRVRGGFRKPARNGAIPLASNGGEGQHSEVQRAGEEGVTRDCKGQQAGTVAFGRDCTQPSPTHLNPCWPNRERSKYPPLLLLLPFFTVFYHYLPLPQPSGSSRARRPVVGGEGWWASGEASRRDNSLMGGGLSHSSLSCSGQGVGERSRRMNEYGRRL